MTRATQLTNSRTASGDIFHDDVTVDGGTGVDCLVLRRDASDAYLDGARDAPVVSEYSRTDVSDVDVTVALSQGQFLFVLDYTEQLTGSGPGDVAVEFRLNPVDPPPDEKGTQSG